MPKKAKSKSTRHKLPKNAEWIAQEHPDTLTMDGFDNCILGVCTRFGQEPIVAYDLKKVLSKLQSGGMTYEEAVEFFEFNQIGAWMGDRTPCFIQMEDM